MNRLWSDLWSLEAEDSKDVVRGIIAKVMLPNDSCHELAETPNHQAVLESHDAGLQKIRHCAADGLGTERPSGMTIPPRRTFAQRGVAARLSKGCSTRN